MFAVFPTVGLIEPHSNIKNVEAFVDIESSPWVEMPKTSQDAVELVEQRKAHLKFILRRKDAEDENSIEVHRQTIDLPESRHNFFQTELFNKKHNSKKEKSKRIAESLMKSAKDAYKYLKQKEDIEDAGVSNYGDNEDTAIPGMQSTHQTQAGPDDKLEEMRERYYKAETRLDEFVKKNLGGPVETDISMQGFVNGLSKRYEEEYVEEINMQVDTAFKECVDRLNGNL